MQYASPLKLSLSTILCYSTQIIVLTELYTTIKVGAISYADKHIQVVEFNLMRLSFTFYCTMLSGYCIFCNNHFFIQFTLFKKYTLYALKW